MSRIQTIAILAISLIATFGAGSAEAGRPRMIVLDEDVLAVTHDSKFEEWANLILMRSPTGEALVVDSRPNVPVAVHRLGVQVPANGVEAHYIEAPDGSILMALAMNENVEKMVQFGVRAFQYDCGDTATHEVGHWYVADPNSVQLGIIAVLIGLVQEPVETVSISFAKGGGEVAIEEITLAYESISRSFVPVEQTPSGWVYTNGGVEDYDNWDEED